MSEESQPTYAVSPRGRASHVRGLVLAAGAGRRMGGPKALVRRRPDEPTLVERAVELLHAGGCNGVTVVVGAAGREVGEIISRVAHDVDVVPCPDWHEGMGASLRAGLTALARVSHEGGVSIDAALVTLVDLPDLTPAVVGRVLDVEGREEDGALRASLRRAAYDRVPGHPALIGRDHWERVVATATGDHGAREHFRTTPHELVECGDLATGHDADTRGELDALS